MNDLRRVLGPASVRWNDYVGTAAADDADAVADHPSLYRLAEIDRDRWTILSIDLTVLAQQNTITVYAVDRATRALETFDDIEELGRTAGEIPVVAFPVPAHRIEDFLNQAFKRIAVRLVARGVRDQVLVAEPRTAD